MLNDNDDEAPLVLLGASSSRRWATAEASHFEFDKKLGLTQYERDLRVVDPVTLATVQVDATHPTLSSRWLGSREARAAVTRATRWSASTPRASRAPRCPHQWQGHRPSSWPVRGTTHWSAAMRATTRFDLDLPAVGAVALPWAPRNVAWMPGADLLVLDDATQPRAIVVPDDLSVITSSPLDSSLRGRPPLVLAR